MKKIRCAIYTRKSTEDGLEQEFNSLDAQREACAAYITSQKNEGWVQVPESYDDGGMSGGTLERPGLQRLLADIRPGRVDQLQEQLQTGAVMQRSGKGRNQRGGKKQVSLLIGKVFDETGDRLTPCHTKTAKGRRLRYYVSHRLIRNSGKKDPGGWRLPGPELESAVAKLVAGNLNEPEVAANIVSEVTTEELAVFSERLSELTRNSEKDNTVIYPLIERIDIARGRITAALDIEAVAGFLGIDSDRINGDLMAISSEFRHRKRGVETLFRNIARANRYLTMIISGQTLTEIGEIEGVTGRRIQQLIELSFLAPGVIRDVFEGRQPVGLTTEWLLHHAYSPIWQDQRDIICPL